MMFKQILSENTWAAVFSDPKLPKKNEFLQTPNSLEIAQAAQKLFAAGNKRRFKIQSNGVGRHFSLAFFIYRKINVMFKAMSGKTTLLIWIIVGLNILTIFFIAICIYFMEFAGFMKALFDIDITQQNYHKDYSGS